MRALMPAPALAMLHRLSAGALVDRPHSTTAVTLNLSALAVRRGVCGHPDDAVKDAPMGYEKTVSRRRIVAEGQGA
jgi:hypothetical protein